MFGMCDEILDVYATVVRGGLAGEGDDLSSVVALD